MTSYKTGDQLITEHVNRYVTDGDVAVAGLVEVGPTSLSGHRASPT